jgi:hypothetical protein
MEATFTEIYESNAWGNRESASGSGSTKARAADFMDELIALLKRLNTRVLLDAPCGDFNWTGPVADAVERYIGVDVVPELIALNRAANSRRHCRFLCRDLTSARLPRADVILCRDCLGHFSSRDIGRALRNFRRSGSRYLLTTTFLRHRVNDEIPTGAWRTLNLEAAPFRFPPPLACIDEKCKEGEGIYSDKSLALWALADLPDSMTRDSS